MSSKTAETAPRRGWSISTRLVALFVASTVVVLLASSLFLDRALVTDFDAQDDQFLRSKIAVLRQILAVSPHPIDDLRPEVQWQAAGLSVTQFWVRIVDANGKIIIETPGFAALSLPLSAFPQNSSGRARAGQAHEPIMLEQASATLRNGKPVTILIILDKSDDLAVITKYREKSLLVVLIAFLSSTLIGIAIVRRGMRPLERIASAASRITASRLHERVRLGEWPAELMPLATAFDEMLERLEDSFRRLSQFSADLAHELRTPLSNLMGEIEVSLRKERTAAEYRSILESNLEDCARLFRMIDGLLFLARADSGTDVTMTDLDAAHEIEAVVDFHDALAEQKQISIRVCGSARLRGNSMLFRRALTNLISNALKFTPPGGEITIEAGERASGTAITVSDTGVGIPSEHLPRLFDRFYRVDPSRSHQEEGTGLGLAIVKSVMDLHGGSVAIKSTAGRGTSIQLVFPPVAAAGGSAAATAGMPAASVRDQGRRCSSE
jgi:two-component system, OmpR family, heavy metal sensor histidine kinase CusS